MDRKRIPIKEGWFRLWYDIGAKSNGWEIFFDMFKRHCERHRYYHGYSHVMQLLKEFEEVRHLCQNPNAVEMFLRSHDAIYYVGAADNEKQSARFISGKLHDARVAELFIEELHRLILLSKKHIAAKNDNDGCLAIDLDLSILGQPLAVFDAYEENIRKEWVLNNVALDEDFMRGRVKFLKTFLKRESIYLTPYFREKYEDTARKNLERSRKNLQLLLRQRKEKKPVAAGT